MGLPMVLDDGNTGILPNRFGLKPEYAPVLANAKNQARNAGSLFGSMFSNEAQMNLIAAHVADKLPQLMDFNVDEDAMILRLQQGLQQRIQPAIIQLQNIIKQGQEVLGKNGDMYLRNSRLNDKPIQVSIEERVGAKGLVPIGLGVGVITGTQIVFSASGFQGVSQFKHCRFSFNDPTGALLYITQFSVGTNNRFAIANSSFTTGYVTSAARFREQHAAFQPGDGFFCGTLQLDNSTQLAITGQVATGTAPATQILCTIYGVPSGMMPSGYAGDDCACTAE